MPHEERGYVKEPLTEITLAERVCKKLLIASFTIEFLSFLILAYVSVMEIVLPPATVKFASPSQAILTLKYYLILSFAYLILFLSTLACKVTSWFSIYDVRRSKRFLASSVMYALTIASIIFLSAFYVHVIFEFMRKFTPTMYELIPVKLETLFIMILVFAVAVFLAFLFESVALYTLGRIYASHPLVVSGALRAAATIILLLSSILAFGMIKGELMIKAFDGGKLLPLGTKALYIVSGLISLAINCLFLASIVLAIKGLKDTL